MHNLLFLAFAVSLVLSGYWWCTTDDLDPKLPVEWCTAQVMTEAINQGLLEGKTNEELNESLSNVRSACRANWEGFLAWVEAEEEKHRLGEP